MELLKPKIEDYPGKHIAFKIDNPNSSFDPFNFYLREVTRGTLKGFTGHREIIRELADALGWKIANIERKVEPQVSKIQRQGQFFTIESGKVCGVKTETSGFRDDGEMVITLTLMVVFQSTEEASKEDAKLGFKAGDFITIDGDPKLEIEVKGFSDAAQLTANHAVNSIPYVIHARPGLLNPKDFPPFAPRV